MSDFEHLSESSLSSHGYGSSGNEADSEREEVCEKDVKEITDMMKWFTTYMFEPEKDNVSSISSSSSEVEDDENDSESTHLVPCEGLENYTRNLIESTPYIQKGEETNLSYCIIVFAFAL